MNTERIGLNLDGKTLANIVTLCSRQGKTPGALLGEIIREKAKSHGIPVEKTTKRSA